MMSSKDKTKQKNKEQSQMYDGQNKLRKQKKMDKYSSTAMADEK